MLYEAANNKFIVIIIVVVFFALLAMVFKRQKVKERFDASLHIGEASRRIASGGSPSRQPKTQSSNDSLESYLLNTIKENFSKINPDYSRIPLSIDPTGAYTEDKKRIAICLKDPKTGKYYSENTLAYVSIHELAHVVTKSYEEKFNNHGPQFKSNFNQLLRQAEALGIYDPNLPLPKNYCGAKE
jgi:predicted metal-dependent hydrolase